MLPTEPSIESLAAENAAAIDEERAADDAVRVARDRQAAAERRREAATNDLTAKMPTLAAVVVGSRVVCRGFNGPFLYDLVKS